MTNAPTLSIVIPAFNEERCIGDCLRSLARQEIGVPFEVVLVDNNSTDATVRVARATANGLQLRVVHESRQGRGAARHTGFATARGTILVSADADTTYPQRWLRGLLDGLASDDVVAVTTTARIDDLAWWRNAAFNLGQPLAMCVSGLSTATTA